LVFEDQINFEAGNEQAAFAWRGVVPVPATLPLSTSTQATMKLSYLLPLIAASPLFAAAFTADLSGDAAEAAPSTSTLTAPTESTASPAAPSTLSSSPWFDWTRLVTTGPIHHLLTLAGVNITQHLAAATQRANEKPWDTRIPMITDENWEHMVVNEPLSSEEEKDRTWFMVVCVPPFLVTTKNMLIMLP
jgi:hypothetical protein